MAPFGSESQAMISVRNNLALLKKRTIRNWENIADIPKSVSPLELPEPTPSQLERIISRIRFEAQRQRRLHVVRVFLAVLFSAALVYALVLYFRLLT